MELNGWKNGWIDGWDGMDVEVVLRLTYSDSAQLVQSHV
jgi:hypothetical protein